MKNLRDSLIRIAMFLFVFVSWMWVLAQPFSEAVNLTIIVGAVLLVFPVVWLGRLLLDRGSRPGGRRLADDADARPGDGAVWRRHHSRHHHLRVLARLGDTRSARPGSCAGHLHRHSGTACRL